MRNFVYPALLTPDEQDGGFVVTFPDVPEAITQGEDVSDALQQAADCLEEAIAGRIRRQACLPEASPARPDHSDPIARANCGEGGAVPGRPADRYDAGRNRRASVLR